MKHVHIPTGAISTLLYVALPLFLQAQNGARQPADAVAIVEQVNDYWQKAHPQPGNAFWHAAAYHTGNMAAYELTGNERYRAYSEAWAEHNQWQGAKSSDKSRWKYRYGETDDFVLFGDWQICFQTYVDLYNLQPDERKIARAREVMEYEMSTPNSDYWWWADGLYMVMPVMTKLYKVTGNELYLAKLSEYFSYAKRLMYDENAGLFYRDAKYIYPKHQTKNGKKDFWSRGNGWVFAGLAKALSDLPAEDTRRQEYANVFLSMAKALKQAQQPEGHWTRSLLDAAHAPGYETSGTAFFACGLLWGISNGLLQKAEYEETALSAWKYLVSVALQPNGTVGYVQPIGERADQHVVSASTTADFGVGAFLLAASEMARYAKAQQAQAFYPGEVWKDNNGVHINAHGGGILFHEGKYYWFGEHKAERSNNALVGVTCYSSGDLYSWKNESIALSVAKNDTASDIQEGCIIERPKVIFNKKTGKFVMYFHLELKGKGYNAARVGIAVADKVTGPYKYLKSCRPNAGRWPVNMTTEQQQSTVKPSDFPKSWTEEWRKAVDDGMFVRRDFAGGQMSRDMTLYVDDDGKACHIYASEDNLTLHLAELSDDYLSYTGKYIRIAPGGHNEAPAIFKKNGKYFMITSGCTGWAPNAARLFTADNLWGAWTQRPNPCSGADAELTFHAQSTCILPVQGKKDAFIFMADRWTPRHPIDGRYIWLPILFENGLPVLKWADKWDLTAFDSVASPSGRSEATPAWTLVWSDEFNLDGKPDSTAWTYEKGFVRNQELQWYQPSNAICKNGVLVLSGKKEKVPNPDYSPESKDWRRSRQFAEYTASSIKTAGKKEFQYGRFEIRAKIPTAKGAWPAIWTLGASMPWPSCGEIDIMEYYRVNDQPHILANTAWGTDVRHNAKWNTVRVPFATFKEKDPEWENKFHIWRMDWDEDAIRLYLDDELLNETLLKDTQNGAIGSNRNPFRQPHYILLNLALGQNGGTPDSSAFPLTYEVDYVRVYQKRSLKD
ncbi:MAG: glycoside hydrolase family 88 protein [Prevotellaceae bacterium]|jgi:rhamnogalacturonyl hydrolase YesR/beta-glucanase (GH16 family)|nr:glycoside hydrolase family 88 protein [Prevotellaceae bacterium]